MMNILLRLIALSVGIWVTVRMPHSWNPYNPENRVGIAAATTGVVVSAATVAWRRNRTTDDLYGVLSLFVVAMIANEALAGLCSSIWAPEYWFVILLAWPFLVAPTALPATWFFLSMFVPKKGRTSAS